MIGSNKRDKAQCTFDPRPLHPEILSDSEVLLLERILQEIFLTSWNFEYPILKQKSFGQGRICRKEYLKYFRTLSLNTGQYDMWLKNLGGKLRYKHEYKLKIGRCWVFACPFKWFIAGQGITTKGSSSATNETAIHIWRRLLSS